jgi:CDP-glycerol glycerophosphotransferase (TagB/SpsB family)
MKKLILGFESVPSYVDNSKIFYEYLVKNHSDKFDFVWLISNETEISFFKEKNIEYLYLYDNHFEKNFDKIDIIFSTHNQFLYYKKAFQTFITLWHGVGGKKVAYFNEIEIEEIKNINFNDIDYFITTSELMRVILSRAFNMYMYKFVLLGQPRVDALFYSDGAKILSDNLGISTKKYSKVLLYLPTFRQTSFRIDGDFNKSNSINLLAYDEKDLNNFLSENNYLLLIKYHNFEKSVSNFEKSENIIVLDNNILTNKKIDISEFINIADMVLTDYSSAHTDFLRTNRPVLFIHSDMEEYTKKRGTYFNDFDFWYPGPSVSTIDEFKIEVLRLFEDSNYYKKERDRYNKIVNNSLDIDASHNCERLVNFIFEKVIPNRHNEILHSEKEVILEQQKKIEHLQQTVVNNEGIITDMQQTIANNENKILDMQQTIVNNKNIILDMQQTVQQLQQSIYIKDNAIAEMKQTVEGVLNSNSWKITKPLRASMKIFKK